MSGQATLSGEFTSTGTSATIAMPNDFDLSISGFGSASVNLERSFDSGVTWKVIETFTADAEKSGRQVRYSVMYRFNCVSHTSGTIQYLISR